MPRNGYHKISTTELPRLSEEIFPSELAPMEVSVLNLDYTHTVNNSMVHNTSAPSEMSQFSSLDTVQSTIPAAISETVIREEKRALSSVQPTIEKSIDPGLACATRHGFTNT